MKAYNIDTWVQVQKSFIEAKLVPSASTASERPLLTTLLTSLLPGASRLSTRTPLPKHIDSGMLSTQVATGRRLRR